MERGQIKILNRDILKYTSPHRCYTIFLEVLDNLPHDKVIKNETSSPTYDKFSLANIETNEEKYENVDNDKLIKECLDLYIKCEKFK